MPGGDHLERALDRLLHAGAIGQADCGSMREAIRMAAQMARASLHTVATPPI